MRILQVAHGFPPSAQAGAELHCYWLSKELVKRGHEVAVFCREGGTELPDYSIMDDTIDGFPVRRVVNNCRKMWGAPLHSVAHLEYRDDRIGSLLDSYLDEFQPDVVHVQHCRGLSASIMELLRRRGVPHILTLHDYWYLCQRVNLLRSDGSMCDGPAGGTRCGRCQGLTSIDATMGDLRRYRRLYRLADSITNLTPDPYRKHVIPRWHFLVGVAEEKAYALRIYVDRTSYLVSQVQNTSHLICPSDFARDVYLSYGISREHCHVVPQGINVERWEGFVRKPSPITRFGFLGTLLRSKGVHVLLEAYQRVGGPSTSLVVHGNEGDDPVYGERIRHLAKECGARLTGRYDNSRLTEILSEIDVLVVPSLWHETYGIVVREGQLSGAPIIASRIGALPEAIREGVDGILVEPGDSHELADQMRQFIEDPSLLRSMREQARPCVVTIEENAELIERVYREAMS